MEPWPSLQTAPASLNHRRGGQFFLRTYPLRHFFPTHSRVCPNTPHQFERHGRYFSSRDLSPFGVSSQPSRRHLGGWRQHTQFHSIVCGQIPSSSIISNSAATCHGRQWPYPRLRHFLSSGSSLYPGPRLYN